MSVCSSACWRPLRAALFASFSLAALAGVAVAETLSDGVKAYGRKDYATARRILRPLAERGSAIAQFYLGLSYERGKRLSESEAEAVNWFRKAAEHGLAASQAALGTRYFIGWGVPQSYAEAMNWSLKAAKQGNPSAQAILGTIYESGCGVPKNFVLAYMWFICGSPFRRMTRISNPAPGAIWMKLHGTWPRRRSPRRRAWRSNACRPVMSIALKRRKSLVKTLPPQFLRRQTQFYRLARACR
jgi:hypothetical protein